LPPQPLVDLSEYRYFINKYRYFINKYRFKVGFLAHPDLT
jgi:hypothetical protein